MEFFDNISITAGLVLSGLLLCASTLHFLLGRYLWKSAVAEVPPLPDLAPLGGSEHGVAVRRDPVETAHLDRLEARTAAEWEAYELAVHPMRPGAVELAGTVGSEVPPPSSPATLRAVLTRERIRAALFAYASGGAMGLLEAYEELNYEIMTCGLVDGAAGIGTRQWLLRQGWITEEEEDRFLKTVLKYRCNDHVPSFEPFSPEQAQLFVRKVLLEFIRYCAARQNR
jgi:hypothetical protein